MERGTFLGFTVIPEFIDKLQTVTQAHFITSQLLKYLLLGSTLLVAASDIDQNYS